MPKSDDKFNQIMNRFSCLERKLGILDLRTMELIEKVTEISSKLDEKENKLTGINVKLDECRLFRNNVPQFCHSFKKPFGKKDIPQRHHMAKQFGKKYSDFT